MGRLSSIEQLLSNDLKCSVVNQGSFGDSIGICAELIKNVHNQPAAYWI